MPTCIYFIFLTCFKCVFIHIFAFAYAKLCVLSFRFPLPQLTQKHTHTDTLEVITPTSTVLPDKTDESSYYKIKLIN